LRPTRVGTQRAESDVYGQFRETRRAAEGALAELVADRKSQAAALEDTVGIPGRMLFGGFSGADLSRHSKVSANARGVTRQ
jgi:hypothetical protein